MVRQTNTASQDIRQICVEKFQEWWDIDELKDTLRFMTSQSVFDLLKNGKKDSENFLDNKQNVAELLFDSIGPRFLHTVLTEDKQEHVNRTKQFWVKIFETTIKKKIVKEISKWSKPKTIIASSSSGLLPSKIQASCDNPQRFLIAHPFNPVYLLPLVELVKGKKTSQSCINRSKLFYRLIGMYPLILKKEVEGYLSDRLQEALWRESLHIINDNLATTDDLDNAIVQGPGLRWALMGTFLTFHLAGGKQGLKHTLKQFGPTLQLPWTKIKAPKLTKKLSKKIVNGTKMQSKGKSIEELANMRDNFLIDLLKLKNKYKLK